MITLKRNSRLARWAFLLDSPTTHWVDDPPTYHRGKVPPQTTLCALFWRAFFIVPVALLALAACLGGLLILIIGSVIHHPWGVLYGVAGAALTFLFLVALAYGSNKLENTLFVAGVKAVKGKFCPIIKFD